MSYMDRVRACNRWNPDGYQPLYCGGEVIGRLQLGFARRLHRWPEIFQPLAGGVVLHPRLDTAEGRTAALARVVEELAAEGHIAYLLGEPYPVTASTRDRALFDLDRGAVPYFGVRAFGQHLNGYCRIGGEIRMWVGRRAQSRINFPGRLDNLVAGGLPSGISPAENLAKECHEEAGIGPELAARARSVGAITYCYETEKGLKPDVLYCYDLELPEEFRPRSVDGEMAAFDPMPLAEVAEIVRTGEAFKPNCALVVIDFLIRHGFLTSDSPEYLDLLAGLHVSLP